MNKVQDVVQIQLPQAAANPSFGEEYGVSIVNGAQIESAGGLPRAVGPPSHREPIPGIVAIKEDANRKKSVVSPGVETGPMGKIEK